MIMSRTFGAWGVATVWDKEKRVAVQGPACTTTTAGAGWFSTRDAGDEVVTIAAGPRLADVEEDIHGFAFSSDLLLDAARWDRFPTSEPDQSQDSIKFVQRLLVEDYNKSSSIVQRNCSEIMAWRLVDTTLLLY
jgi:putative beta-1,4-xylosyltransferase IRX9